MVRLFFFVIQAWVCAAVLRGTLKRRIERAESAQDDAASHNDAASSSDQPRGTLRRRIERAEGAQEIAQEDLPLVGTLKRNWAKGKISSAMVQEIAHGAEAQGAGGMSALSSAGTSGKHAQNLQRSILKYFGSPPGAPDFSWIQIPTTKGHTIHPIFLPHEYFSKLYHNAPHRWLARRWSGHGV